MPDNDRARSSPTGHERATRGNLKRGSALPGAGSLPAGDVARQIQTAGTQPRVADLRALQGTLGNRAVQRLLRSKSDGTAQRKPDPERERLERVRMWGELLQQRNGLVPADAHTLAEAFANTGTSIVTLQGFAPLLSSGWTAAGLVTLIRKFTGESGGRSLDDWVTFAVRRPGDPDAVATGVRAGQVDWVNVSASFKTHNDRYTAAARTPAGKQRVFTFDGTRAALQEQTLDGTQTVYEITGEDSRFLVTAELKDLLLSDSQYHVTPAGYTRHAPVNLVEAPGEVDFTASRHFTYMPASGPVHTAIMSSDDPDLTVKRIEGGSVIFDVSGTEYPLSLAPQAGYQPFDFNYDAATGSITEGHPGHPLYL